MWLPPTPDGSSSGPASKPPTARRHARRGVLFAEQTDTIRKLDAAGREFVYVTDTHGAGALSLDARGRLFAVQRTCTDPGKPVAASCRELTSIAIRMLAEGFKGRPK